MKRRPRPKRAAGTGSTFQRKRDGRWVAQISSGPRGSQKFTSRLAADADDAQLKLAELIAERDQDLRQKLDPLTVGAFLGSWVAEARGIRPTTRHGYQAVVTTHLVPMIGHIPLASLTPAHVETMLASLDGTMQPKSLRNIHGVLRRALQQAVRTDRAERNVASREFIDAPRVPLVEPRALTVAEVDRLLAVIAGDAAADPPVNPDRLEPLIVVALGTGLRQGELLGLAWEDVEDEPGTIIVRQELIYLGRGSDGKGRYDRGEPKTERSRRRVPATPAVAAALERQRAQSKAAGFVPTSSSPVFVSPAGVPLSGSWVTHHFYDLLKTAKIERLPFKNLRSTFATRLLEAGVSDVTIAALMGHNRTHTTKKHYMAVTPELAREAVEAMARRAG